jgi:osmoprotectant transport system permease protein
VDYSGTIWANYMQRNDTRKPEIVVREVTRWLEKEHSIRSLGALGFENAYALAMRRDRADELGVESLSDLAAHSATMKIGGSYEFFGRPEWARVRETYGLRFDERKQYEATFMYRAVQNGDVDVIAAFTSDGRIIEYGLRVLEDPKDGIPPFDALLLLSSDASRDEQVTKALQPLLGKLTIDLMREANLRVDIHEESPEQAAAYLARELGLAGTE